MHVLPSALHFGAGFELRSEPRVLGGVGAQGADCDRAGLPAVVVVQCSIPPNSRTVQGSRTSSWKSWLLGGALGLLFTRDAALACEREQRGGELV